MVLAPGVLRPGTHDLTLRYGGDARHRPSSSTVRVVVEKATPRLSLRAPDAVDRGERARLVVRLRAPYDVPVRGTVKVTVRGRTITRTVEDGRVVLRLPAVGPGRLRVRVAYLGSDLVAATRDRVTIRVRR